MDMYKAIRFVVFEIVFALNLTQVCLEILSTAGNRRYRHGYGALWRQCV